MTELWPEPGQESVQKWRGRDVPMSLSGVVKAMVEVIAATEDRENPGMRLAHRLSGRSRRSSVLHGQARSSIYSFTPEENGWRQASIYKSPGNPASSITASWSLEYGDIIFPMFSENSHIPMAFSWGWVMSWMWPHDIAQWQPRGRL